MPRTNLGGVVEVSTGVYFNVEHRKKKQRAATHAARLQASKYHVSQNEVEARKLAVDSLNSRMERHLLLDQLKRDELQRAQEERRSMLRERHEAITRSRESKEEGRRAQLKELQKKEAERALRYQLSKLQQYSMTVSNKTCPRERAATSPSASLKRQTSSYELFHHPAVLQHMDNWQMPADWGPSECFSPVSTKPGTRGSRLESPQSSLLGSPAFATSSWMYSPTKAKERRPFDALSPLKLGHDSPARAGADEPAKPGPHPEEDEWALRVPMIQIPAPQLLVGAPSSPLNEDMVDGGLPWQIARLSNQFQASTRSISASSSLRSGTHRRILGVGRPHSSASQLSNGSAGMSWPS
uniref:Uncharacterized protein n=1 Tax=Eutreptiella gymnastica TaxID=73025 RepID=A0A7S1N4S1_9EUGL|mmetsp:Transcript_12003/g.21813  ORF Transcript_12003/g.21813 Transcript_12003/m.21813 type:complete len:354 (+) Transcript_12003:57-1118(+)